MEKHHALRRTKRWALGCLLGSAALFVAASLAPPSTGSALLRAMAEAAMVGALADWFAVTALFRRIPLPLLARHTAIIPRNKERIADNLAVFVEEKFLSPQSLVNLLRRHDPAQRLSAWMADPGHAARLGHYMAQAVAGVLTLTDDRRIQAFVREALHTALGKLDLSRSLASILDTLTLDGRHQQLLDRAIVALAELLNREETRDFIAERMVDWLQREYPKIEKLLPSNWIGEKSAATLADILDKLLSGIAQDPHHSLRQAFDRQLASFITRLKQDPALRARAEQIKREVLQGEAVNAYVAGLWDSLRDWLRQDLERADSALHAQAAAATQWIGRALQDDAELRASLNKHLEQAVATLSPELAQLLTRHISDTIKQWDSAELSRQIELNIGRDLQYIRINGTLVGGLIGAVLFALSWLMQWLVHGA
ncbi:uncharacterized membrane-anchored protein YjiN (DUF445 family) [Herbaspirillum rubrisubalbicans]|uniref:DUF445 domain-containing protein n=1 Tax=Herbaspirillum rubrisubalbicans TaxID=80842 RepID=UPI00209FB730|nr:DUF445 family protein [Herbaspirillum rubrisubalbicans]MCP1575386.1 uncharacterized membrane-anchored protein YjiN (DUF445 family) [Herbaspirillum rubrisubalbicans]